MSRVRLEALVSRRWFASVGGRFVFGEANAGSEAASSQLYKVLRDLPQHQSIAPGNERCRCTQLSNGDWRGGGVVVTVIQAAEVPNQRPRQHYDYEGAKGQCCCNTVCELGPLLRTSRQACSTFTAKLGTCCWLARKHQGVRELVRDTTTGGKVFRKHALAATVHGRFCLKKIEHYPLMIAGSGQPIALSLHNASSRVGYGNTSQLEFNGRQIV
jgi:hypothetical protein